MVEIAAKRKRCLGFAFSTYSRCESRAPKWHGFCHRHRLEPLLLGLVGFGVLADYADVTTLLWPPPPAATEKQASDLLGRVGNVERTTEEILKILKGAYDINHERLARDYPLGYSLFYAAAGKSDPELFPAPSPDVDVDWSKVKVVDWFTEPGVLFLSAPKVRDLRTGVGFEEIAVGLPRNATAPTPLFGTESLGLFGEVLESRGKELVFVLGLRREPGR